MAAWPAVQGDNIDTQRDALLDAVTHCIQANFTKLYWIYDRGSGWEKWMQAELEYYLVHTYTNIMVHREELIWEQVTNTQNHRRQVDFVVLRGGLGYIFELKCLISGANATPQAWKAQLGNDFTKLNSKLISQANKTIKFGLGICPNMNAAPAGTDYHAYPTAGITAQDEHGVNRTCVIHYRTFGGV